MVAASLTGARLSKGQVDTGQTVVFELYARDTTGALADAGSAPTIVVTQPDGTALTPAPTATKTATGTYSVPVTPAAAGLHAIRATGTGGGLGTATDVWADVFTVEATSAAFVGVDEASDHLRAAGIITTTSDREQLRWLCLAASGAVEGDLGRVVAPRSVTETYDGGRPALLLRFTPVISVATVTESGVAVASTGWVLDATAGILRRGTTTSASCWAAGWQNVSVTYRVGSLVPPTVARKVALNTIERMWQASQQAPHDALDPDGAVFAAAASLTEVERRAYDGLRSVGIA